VRMRWKMTAATGGVAFVMASLLMLWVGSNPEISDALARHGISFRSAEEAGIPGSEAFGLGRQLRGETHGAGMAGLTHRRFLARRGQVLVLDYDVSVKSGFLRVSVDRFGFPVDELWGKSAHSDHREMMRLPIQTTGIYRLTVTQYRHAGTYRIDWRLENR
jgi:hypothetical protein